MVLLQFSILTFASRWGYSDFCTCHIQSEAHRFSNHLSFLISSSWYPTALSNIASNVQIVQPLLHLQARGVLHPEIFKLLFAMKPHTTLPMCSDCLHCSVSWSAKARYSAFCFNCIKLNSQPGHKRLAIYIKEVSLKPLKINANHVASAPKASTFPALDLHEVFGCHKPPCGVGWESGQACCPFLSCSR